MTIDQRDLASEVQTAQQAQELFLELLRLELQRPTNPVAIGGSMCWAYPIEAEVAVLRRSQIEAQLHLRHQATGAETVDAGRTIFAAVDDHLRGCGFDLPVAWLIYVWRLQKMAKDALLDVLGQSSAVRAVQDSAAEGRPLTVCIGRGTRFAYEAALGLRGLSAKDLRARAADAIAAGELTRLPSVSRSHGDGCGRVHFESESPYHLFSLYCDRCASSSGNKQRTLERRFWAEKYGQLLGLAHCPCGKKYIRSRTNQTRCPDCQRMHRVTLTRSQAQ